jgi:hypothetical protein
MLSLKLVIGTSLAPPECKPGIVPDSQCAPSPQQEYPCHIHRAHSFGMEKKFRGHNFALAI